MLSAGAAHTVSLALFLEVRKSKTVTKTSFLRVLTEIVCLNVNIYEWLGSLAKLTDLHLIVFKELIL